MDDERRNCQQSDKFCCFLVSIILLESIWVVSQVMATNSMSQNGHEMTIPKLLSFNVGGQKFTTTWETLSHRGDNLLTKLVSSYYERRISSTLDSDGSFFIDRSPLLFSIILDFLRSGQLITSATKGANGIFSLSEKALLHEFQYYSIHCPPLASKFLQSVEEKSNRKMKEDLVRLRDQAKDKGFKEVAQAVKEVEQLITQPLKMKACAERGSVTLQFKEQLSLYAFFGISRCTLESATFTCEELPQCNTVSRFFLVCLAEELQNEFHMPVQLATTSNRSTKEFVILLTILFDENIRFTCLPGRFQEDFILQEVLTFPAQQTQKPRKRRNVTRVLSTASSNGSQKQGQEEEEEEDADADEEEFEMLRQFASASLMTPTLAPRSVKPKSPQNSPTMKRGMSTEEEDDESATHSQEHSDEDST